MFPESRLNPVLAALPGTAMFSHLESNAQQALLMSFYAIIRIIHSSCALLSILGFAIRGYGKVSRGEVPQTFAFKVLPHIVDTILLVSAIALVIMSGQYPFVSPWVTAKVIALVVYISFGILLMRLKVEKAARGAIYAVSLLCGAYMVMVAVSKNPIPF